jgi:hypothetical protein
VFKGSLVPKALSVLGRGFENASQDLLHLRTKHITDKTSGRMARHWQVLSFGIGDSCRPMADVGFADLPARLPTLGAMFSQ